MHWSPDTLTLRLVSNIQRRNKKAQFLSSKSFFKKLLYGLKIAGILNITIVIYILWFVEGFMEGWFMLIWSFPVGGYENIIHTIHFFFKIYKYQTDFRKQMKTTIFCFLSFFFVFWLSQPDIMSQGNFSPFFFFLFVRFFWNNWLKAMGGLNQYESYFHLHSEEKRKAFKYLFHVGIWHHVNGSLCDVLHSEFMLGARCVFLLYHFTSDNVIFYIFLHLSQVID